jgi:seryl-tRNA synthetase
MGTEQKMKLDRIINLFEGVKVVEDNTKIDFTISYRLGRLSDSARSIIRTYERKQSKLKIETNEKIQALRKGMDTKTDEEKAVISKEVKELNDEFMAKIDNLMEEEEKIEIPLFSAKDFEGKDVPVKFFSLMGDVIKD